MHCVSWTYPAPASLTKEKSVQLFAQVAEMYIGVPGLVRKYFGYSEDGRTVVTVLQNGQESEREVELGLQNETYAEVKSGLEAGEIVVTE